MKKIILLITAISTLGFSVPLAQAAASDASVATRRTAVQTKGDTDIQARLTSLNALITKVNAAEKLSAAQKSTMTTEMQGEVTSLTALKTKLDAETELAAARTDFQNIFAQHYIYAFYLPRVERIIAADAEVQAAATLTTLAATLQIYITQAKTAGNDVTDLQAKLDDMKTKTAAATTIAQAALTALLPLTASGYPGNKATVQAAATSLKTGRTDLEAARTDARAIVVSLKKTLNLK